jgi:hypothetical protein
MEEKPFDPDAPRDLDESELRRRRQIMTFLREAGSLLLGVGIGFFWCHYYRHTSVEAHIIVILLLVILCLVRYIHLTRE